MGSCTDPIGRDDLIERLARESGFNVDDNGEINDGVETAADFAPNLRRFAALVAEECAKVADGTYSDDGWEARSCAAAGEAIRAKFEPSENTAKSAA